MAGKKGMHARAIQSPIALEALRARIRSDAIVKRLMDHVDSDGGILEATQVTAAIALLRKTIPDLTAVGGTDLLPPIKTAVLVKFHDGRD